MKSKGVTTREKPRDGSPLPSIRSSEMGFGDWATCPEAEVFEKVIERIRLIKAEQHARLYELHQYKQAYDATFSSNTAVLYSPSRKSPSNGFYGVSANVVQSVIDTAQALVVQKRPRPFVIPRKGSYSLRRRCKRQQLYLDGAFEQSGLYRKMDSMFRDACIYGDGYMYPYLSGDKLACKALKIDEVFVDLTDGQDNEPTEIHWVHAEPRRKLLRMYPEMAKEINEARSAWSNDKAHMVRGDRVEVVRSWVLPTEPGAGDGRYSVCMVTGNLEVGEWKRDYLPIVRFQWREPTYGPYGSGIAKAIFGLQRGVSDIHRGIMKSIKTFAAPRVWVSKLAGVNAKAITDEISVNEYSGEKPIFDTPPAASEDVYRWQQWLIDYSFKQEGVSQLSASSEKPAGLNAAVALRTYHDIETNRFALVGQRWEGAHLQCARIFLDIAAESKIPILCRGRSSLEMLEWDDVSTREDESSVEIWPTNILPADPAGQMQAAQELTASGFMPRDVVLSQMRLPNITEWFDEETAARDEIEMLLGKILEDGVYIEPDQVGDLQLCLKLASSAYLRARADEEEPAKVSMLLRFLDRVVQLVQDSLPPAAPPAAPPVPGATLGQAPQPPPAPLAPQGSGAVPPGAQ